MSKIEPIKTKPINCAFLVPGSTVPGWTRGRYVLVPGGDTCRHVDGLRCEYIAWCPQSQVFYCSIFDCVELIHTIVGPSGDPVHKKCIACLKACGREVALNGY